LIGRRDRFYLSNILDAANKVLSYVGDLGRDGFVEAPLVQDAVIRQLEIVGEATKRISDEFRDDHPDIPWKDMAGTRDKLIHDYLGVDIDSVWKTAREDIPQLIRLIEAVL